MKMGFLWMFVQQLVSYIHYFRFFSYVTNCPFQMYRASLFYFCPILLSKMKLRDSVVHAMDVLKNHRNFYFYLTNFMICIQLILDCLSTRTEKKNTILFPSKLIFTFKNEYDLRLTFSIKYKQYLVYMFIQCSCIQQRFKGGIVKHSQTFEILITL